MGSWGPKLYQDDVAEDVRDYYKDQLKRGKTNEEVTKELIEDNEDIISDEEEGPIFWFVLADTQWSLGRLLNSVKEKALECLRNGSDLERWKNEEPKVYLARKKVLEELEVKLNSPMPAEKKISQYKLYKCEWSVGDVFAYKLESEYAIEKGFGGRYAIIYKVDESKWWPGHIVPIVYVKLSNNNEIPKTISEIERCEFVQTTFARSKPEYRMQILSTSKRVIPSKKLIYIGNFKNLSRPVDDFVVSDKVSTVTCNWSNFEEVIINKYLKFK